MSGEPIEGSVHAPQRTDDAAVLAAYREVTGWTDEEILHLASCGECDPRDGDDEWYCKDSPQGRRERAEAATRRPYGEPVRPQPPLPAALRREAERIAGRAKAFAPLRHGAVRSSVTPETLARIREQVGDPGEIRFASGGVIPRLFRRADGVIHGTAGGPYCGVCGAPVDAVPTPAYSGDQTTAPGSCPNGCDPRDAGQSR